MNPILAIEDDLVARLKDVLAGRVTTIDSFPDVPESYDFPLKHSAAVFVRFAGGKYAGASNSPQRSYAPNRTLTWETVLLVRSLRDAQGGRMGAYEGIEKIRLALQGRSFAGATAMVPVSEELQEQKGGVWRWAITFTNSIPAIAAIDYGDRPPLMTGFAEDRA